MQMSLTPAFLSEEIKQEIIKRKVEITKELAEKAFRKKE